MHKWSLRPVVHKTRTTAWPRFPSSGHAVRDYDLLRQNSVRDYDLLYQNSVRNYDQTSSQATRAVKMQVRYEISTHRYKCIADCSIRPLLFNGMIKYKKMPWSMWLVRSRFFFKKKDVACEGGGSIPTWQSNIRVHAPFFFRHVSPAFQETAFFSREWHGIKQVLYV